MKGILGFIFIIAGILVGLYIGVWICFIGGIVQIIEQVRAENLEPIKVAVGIAKIFLSGLAVWLSATIFILPGYGLIVSWVKK